MFPWNTFHDRKHSLSRLTHSIISDIKASTPLQTLNKELSWPFLPPDVAVVATPSLAALPTQESSAGAAINAPKCVQEGPGLWDSCSFNGDLTESRIDSVFQSYLVAECCELEMNIFLLACHINMA